MEDINQKSSNRHVAIRKSLSFLMQNSRNEWNSKLTQMLMGISFPGKPKFPVAAGVGVVFLINYPETAH